jgi:hypothetical protein
MPKWAGAVDLWENDLGGTLFFHPPEKFEGVKKPGGGFLLGKKFFGGGLLRKAFAPLFWKWRGANLWPFFGDF